MSVPRFLVLFLALSLLAPARVRAQAQANAANPVPPEVGALFEDINDIDKLRVLNPLKLTVDQLDRLIAAVTQSQQDYNKKLADAAVPPIKEIAKDIKATRQQMLSGAPIPKDFDDKVKKLQDDYVAKRDKEDFSTLKALSDSAVAILTKEQYATAVSLARKALIEDGKPTAKGGDDKFFNYYVLNVLIKYPRIVPLLQDMRATAGKSAGADVGPLREARR